MTWIQYINVFRTGKSMKIELSWKGYLKHQYLEFNLELSHLYLTNTLELLMILPWENFHFNFSINNFYFVLLYILSSLSSVFKFRFLVSISCFVYIFFSFVCHVPYSAVQICTLCVSGFISHSQRIPLRRDRRCSL